MRVTGIDTLQRNLSGIVRNLDNPEPLMGDIAQILESETSRSFENERSPFGERWEKSRRVLKHGGRTLYDDHTPVSKREHPTHLQDSIYTSHNRSSAKVGTNRSYGKFHQFGTRKMAKREFLPIRDSRIPRELSAEIMSVAREYILNV
jgi:phage virion morphogenesis protein